MPRRRTIKFGLVSLGERDHDSHAIKDLAGGLSRYDLMARGAERIGPEGDLLRELERRKNKCPRARRTLGLVKNTKPFERR
ncbi:hypothetical protein AHF37_02093 [Paragonimus kellicotti]|nr:hypothetical protein AHF37_02093 [Paragonimus kellicotti]